MKNEEKENSSPGTKARAMKQPEVLELVKVLDR